MGLRTLDGTKEGIMMEGALVGYVGVGDNTAGEEDGL
jgi:hypothetical protein